MDRKTWNLVRAAACFPIAVAATQTCTAERNLTPRDQQRGEREAATWTFHHEHVLGTSLEVRVRAKSLAQAKTAETAVLNEIDRQDKILSAWRTDSEFSCWAATKFEPVAVSSELMEVLASFDHWRNETGGALDASAEAAVRLWRQAISEGRTPTDAEITQTTQAIQQAHWQLNETDRTATRVSDVPLALASFAKSYISTHAADAAIGAGATGIMLNIGGDIVVRGSLTQLVEVADPLAPSENDTSLASIMVQNRAVATSGSYRRGVELTHAGSLQIPEFSHIVDPRTSRPTGHVLSSTVIARDAETAGALATAFSVLSVEESAGLAERTSDVEYLLITNDGRQIRSKGWGAYQAPGLRPVSYVSASSAKPTAPHAVAAGMWNPAFELALGLELPRIEDARYRRPYVAVWIEDADHFPLRTLALWTQNPRWLPELKQWYRDDQIRNLSEGTDISKTVSSATRPPGQYTLKWDGKDNEGKPVKAGKYTVVVEASREHGGYQIERREMNFVAQAQQISVQGGKELGTVTLDYRKR